MNDAAPAPVRDRLYGLAAATFKVPAARLSPASGPRTVRTWDSFAHMEFVAALETSFGVRLAAKEILAIDSLARAEAILEAKLAAR
jgi:acyl carrier protein